MSRPRAALLAALLAATPLLPAAAAPFSPGAGPGVPRLEPRGAALELPGALSLEAMAYEAPGGPGKESFTVETEKGVVPANAGPGDNGVRLVQTFRPRTPGGAPSRVVRSWTQSAPSSPDGERTITCRLEIDDPNGLFHATPRPDGSLAGVCIELRLTGWELGGGAVAYDEEVTRRDEQGWEIRPTGPDGEPAPPPDRSGIRRLRADGRRLRITVGRGGGRDPAGGPLRFSESGRFSFDASGDEDCRHVFRFHAEPDPERPGRASAKVTLRLRAPSPESLRLGRAEESRARTVAALDLFVVPSLRLGRQPADAALRSLAESAVPAPDLPDGLADDRPALRMRTGGSPAPVIDLAGEGVPLREALCDLADLAGMEIRIEGGAFVLEAFDPHVRHLSFRIGSPDEENRVAEAIDAGLRRAKSPPAVFRNARVSDLLPFLAAAAAADPDCPPVRFALRLWQTAGPDGSVPPDPTRVTVDRPGGATLHELVEAIATQNRLLWSVQRRTVVFESDPD